MRVYEHCEGYQFKDVADTDAFRSADKAWPFESWDDREWVRVMKVVKKEMKDGHPS